MKKNQYLLIGAIALFVLGLVMVFLGFKASILPPSITGLGFLIIGFVFMGLRKED